MTYEKLVSAAKYSKFYRAIFVKIIQRLYSLDNYTCASWKIRWLSEVVGKHACSHIVGWILGQRRRRWPRIQPTLAQCLPPYSRWGPWTTRAGHATRPHLKTFCVCFFLCFVFRVHRHPHVPGVSRVNPLCARGGGVQGDQGKEVIINLPGVGGGARVFLK